MNGWWKFHRKMIDHALWSLPANHRVVWLTVLSLASHRDAEWWDGKHRVQLHPGDLITSQDSLAERSHTSRQSVRAAIAHLIRLESISTKIATKHYTLISVTNWPLYQGEEEEANQESNQRPTKAQPTPNHIGRMKELKKSTQEGFLRFWNAYPKHRKKQDALRAFEKVAPQNGMLETMLSSIERYSHTQEWTKDNGQFIPYPATWLNGRQWEDEVQIGKKPYEYPDL